MAAILIFVVASALAAWLDRTASSILGDSPTGKLAATALPVLVMAIAVFMILNQLKIASDIVVITYAALMGAVALGMALAFGLGRPRRGHADAGGRLQKRPGGAGPVPRQDLPAQSRFDGCPGRRRTAAGKHVHSKAKDKGRLHQLIGSGRKTARKARRKAK